MRTPPTMSAAVMCCQTAETLTALGYTPPTRPPEVLPVPATRNKMTRTEARYLDEVLLARKAAGEITNIKFHPVIFYMDNGHRYTPDFSYLAGGRACFVEVKGSYRLQSYRSARLAFDQARLEWPCFSWLWVEWNGKEWDTIHDK